MQHQRDRYTAQMDRYQFTHPGGTVETWIVECDKLVHPRKHQFRMTEFAAIVVDRNIPLYNARTKKRLKPRSKVWTFSQSFHGGPSAKGDGFMGGFNTGRYLQNPSRTHYNRVVKDLLDHGFKITQSEARKAA